MPWQKLKWGIYLCTTTGFLTLSLLPGFSSMAIGLFLLILLPSWFMNKNTEPFPGYTRAWNAASILFIVFTLAILLFDVKPTHVVFAYQLGFLEISKAFNPKKSRDVLWMWFLSFFMIVITAVLTRSSLFPFFLCAFLFLSVYSLFWLGIFYETEKLARDEKALSKLRHLPRYRAVTKSWSSPSEGILQGEEERAWRRTISLSGVLAFLFSLLIFLLIPRMTPRNYNLDIHSDPIQDHQMVFTGFSTEINLGSLRNMKLDPRTVMEVRVTGKMMNEENLYLRGGTYDLFSGTSWMKSQSSRKYKLYNIDPRTRKVWFGAPSQENNGEFLDTEQESLPSGIIRQEIRFLDFPTRYIFSLPNLIMLTSEEGLFENVFRDYAETCFILPPRTLRNYVAYSLPKRPEQSGSDAVVSNNAFTYIPPSLNKERLTALASKIAGKASTSFEKARRIESFLLNEYQYTLKVGSLRRDNPIEDFLFSLKAGHCELFATSMIMLLRTQNAPCRLAFGFHGGQYHEEENTFTIRQSDAHTWVEVFDPKEGWQRFDPTPPIPMTIYADRLYFKKLFDFFVTLSEKWENFTLGYNNHYQIELVRTIMDSFKKEMGKTFAPLITKIRHSRSLARLVQNFRNPFILGLTGLLLVFNIFVIRVYLRFKRRRTGKTGIPQLMLSQRRATHWYHILVKTIAGRSVEKPARDTPREFILSLGAHYQIPHELLSECCRTFYALRFGPQQNVSGLIKYLTQLLNDIRNVREAGR